LILLTMIYKDNIANTILKVETKGKIFDVEEICTRCDYWKFSSCSPYCFEMVKIYDVGH
jgi:hypothetical protein